MEEADEVLHIHAVATPQPFALADLEIVTQLVIAVADIVLRGEAVLEAALQQLAVAPGDNRHSIGALAITPRTACLLEVFLQRGGHGEMQHQTHVGLINPHTEGIGRDHDAHLAPHPARLA